MDSPGRYQKNKSLFPFKKNLRSHLALAVLLAFSCQSSSKNLKYPTPPDYLLIEGVKQLTFEGDNDSPRFSPDSQRIVFISRSRTSHRNTQVYEMDISQNKERRVTFQDGEIRGPTYINNDTILYASSTDEIKETLIEKSSANARPDRPPMELYQSDLYGNEILRVTHFAGHDSEPTFVFDGKPYILFTSYRAGLLGIFKFDLSLHRRQTSYFLLEKAKDRWSPTVSENRKYVAWLEKDHEGENVRIMVSQMRRLITTMTPYKEEKEIRDLSFVPNSAKLIYSVKRTDQENNQIEIFDFEKKCTQIVFSGTDSLTQPSVSAAGTQVVLTRQVRDRKQIYMVPMPKDLGPCLETLE
jgi:WD40 repeat protein